MRAIEPNEASLSKALLKFLDVISESFALHKCPTHVDYHKRLAPMFLLTRLSHKLSVVINIRIEDFKNSFFWVRNTDVFDK